MCLDFLSRYLAGLSTEAEYIAISCAVSETIWLCGHLTGLQESSLYPVQIFEDNQGAVAIAEKEETKYVKHINVKFHYFREADAEGKAIFVPTQKQEPDILTKPLPASNFNALWTMIGLEAINLEGVKR